MQTANGKAHKDDGVWKYLPKKWWNSQNQKQNMLPDHMPYMMPPSQNSIKIICIYQSTQLFYGSNDLI